MKVDLGPEPRHLPGARRLGAGRQERSTSSARAATRSGSTCSRSIRRPAEPHCCSARTAPDLDQPHDNYKSLKDGSLIWWSERDGFGHLYRFADGQWTQLTQRRWVVTDLAGVDQAIAPPVLHRHQGRRRSRRRSIRSTISIPGEPQRLTDPAFANSGVDGQEGHDAARHALLAAQPPQVYLADETGKRLTWVEENKLDASHPYAPYLASHRAADVRHDQGGRTARTLYWKMITPPLEPGKRYPVFFEHYGGPHRPDGQQSLGHRRSRKHRRARA